MSKKGKLILKEGALTVSDFIQNARRLFFRLGSITVEMTVFVVVLLPTDFL